jgi:hypothetical protein
MTEPQRLFGADLSAVQVGNLRAEFSHHLKLLSDPEFQSAFSRESSAKIQTDYLIWTGVPSDFLTLVCQRAVLGVEATLPVSVMMQAGKRGIASPEVWRALRHPFSLGRSTLQVLYDRLPALVNSAWSLPVARPDLFETTRRFYRDIRSPLLHGSRLQNAEGRVALAIHEHIRDLYAWIDSW